MCVFCWGGGGGLFDGLMDGVMPVVIICLLDPVINVSEHHHACMCVCVCVFDYYYS